MTLALAITGWWLAISTWLGIIMGPRLGRSEQQIRRAYAAWLLVGRLANGQGLAGPQLRAARDQWVNQGDVESLVRVITWAGLEGAGSDGGNEQH